MSTLENPLLSIVIPAYNRPEMLRETLSLIRTNVPVAYEVLIHDNSEKPLALEAGPDVRIRHNGKNLGAAARNSGIEAANGTFTLMLDDDSAPTDREGLQKALQRLRTSPNTLAGLIAEIIRPDGSREASLLPTVFQGCGALFKTEILKKLHPFYPDNFFFYGEEYWSSLLLYRHGYRLEHSADLLIEHRTDLSRRNVERIFYYLARNKGTIWETMAAENIAASLIRESYRRYELTSRKEGVLHAFQKGCKERLIGTARKPVSDENMKRFLLLDCFEACAEAINGKDIVLCGSGKFPELWSNVLLETCGARSAEVYDFNPALHGQWSESVDIKPPEHLDIAGRVCIVGHSSRPDTQRWIGYLQRKQVEPVHIRESM